MAVTPTALGHEPQHMVAMREANRLRYRRAREHEKVGRLGTVEGRKAVARLLLKPPEWLRGEKVGALLCWPHRMGRRGMQQALQAAGLNGYRLNELSLVRDLTKRQRRALADWLRGDA